MKKTVRILLISIMTCCVLLALGCAKGEETGGDTLLATAQPTPTLEPVVPTSAPTPEISVTPVATLSPEPAVTNPPATDPPVTSKPEIAATGVTVGNNVNIRSGPGTDFDTVDKVNEGTQIEVVKKNYTNDWHQIWYDGQIAYISTDFIQFGTKPDTLYSGYVNSNTLNVRAAASTSSSVLGTLKNGDAVQLVSKTADNGWFQIWFENQFAYVSAEYITVGDGASVEGDADIPKGAVKGTVTASKAALRYKPSTEGNTPVSEVSKGDVLAVYFKTGDFYCVSKLGSDSKYYVYASYVQVSEDVPSGTPIP